MTEHNNQLSIDGKRVVSKAVNDKGDVNGEETFTVTFEDGSTQQLTATEMRLHEEANIEED